MADPAVQKAILKVLLSLPTPVLRAMSGDVVAFSPPLIIERPQIDELMGIVRIALDETLHWAAARA